ncbi:PH domain-containing protein [Beutenbergia cavernae]|uniref:PH domain-containing protein n=1 Tax=Beutenbergia cavernae TaxID=84757 RepID=UPI0002D5FA29|nr:PH domain-containing protein [Beutenbergia cavernae]
MTPLLNAWKVAAALLAIFVWQYARELSELDLPGVTLVLVIVGVIVLGTVIGLVYSWLAWRRLTFRITAEAVVMHSGVLFRRERDVRLDRVQAVDVTQPLLGRIFGFAALKIESAGGAESNITLSYLTEDQAQALRNEILARAAGLEVTADDAGQVAPVPRAPEREVLAVGPGMVLGSLALSGATIAFVLLCVGVAVGAIAVRSWGFVFSILPMLLGFGAYFWGRFSGEFSFRAAISPDGIRVRHGLLEHKARTVPPGRIQAVQIHQPPLWRLKDWWRVQVNIAAYGPAGQTESLLLPVGSRQEALTALWLALPDLGDDDAATLLDSGLVGRGDAAGWTSSPRRARWLDPMAWRRNGFRITRTALLLRGGWLWRTLQVVPHERTQSLAVERGPWQRRLGLTSFAAHSTNGPVRPRVAHLDAAVALELLLEQSERAHTARQAAGPEQWMLRVAPDLAAEAEAPADPAAEAEAPADPAAPAESDPSGRDRPSGGSGSNAQA